MDIKPKCDISKQNFTNSRSTAAFFFLWEFGVFSMVAPPSFKKGSSVNVCMITPCNFI